MSHLTAGVLYGRGCCVVEGKEATLITISHVAAAQSALVVCFPDSVWKSNTGTEFLTVSPGVIGTHSMALKLQAAVFNSPHWM